MNYLQLGQAFSTYLKNRCTSPLDVRKAVFFSCVFPMAEFQEEECTQLLYAVQAGLQEKIHGIFIVQTRQSKRNACTEFQSIFFKLLNYAGIGVFFLNIQCDVFPNTSCEMVDAGKTEEAHLGCTKSCHSSTARGWDGFANRTIWVFPKIMVALNHPMFNRVFHYKPSILGVFPLFVETSIWEKCTCTKGGHHPPWHCWGSRQRWIRCGGAGCCRVMRWRASQWLRRISHPLKGTFRGSWIV